MKRFFFMSKKASSSMCIFRTTAGGGCVIRHNTATRTTTTVSSPLLLLQPCCGFPRHYYYCFSSLSSSSLSAADGGGGGGSINRHEDKHEDLHEDDEDEDEEDDDDYDYDEAEDDDNYCDYEGWPELRWYHNLRRYEKQLLRELKQQQQQSSSSSSSTNESSLSSIFRHDEKTDRRSLNYVLLAKGDATLVRWMNINRLKYRQGVLSKEQQEALKKTLQRVLLRINNSSNSASSVVVGTAADITVAAASAASAAAEDISAVVARLLEPRLGYWRDMYQQLCTFVQDHDGNFPYDYPVEELTSLLDRRLFYWCQRQKKDYKAYHHQQHQVQDQHHPSATSINIIMQDRIQKLEALGFVWHEHDKSWNEQYQELKSYKKHHGDCLVPMDYPTNPQLAKWVSDQRTMYKRYCQEQEQQQAQQDHHQTSLIDTTATDETSSSSWAVCSSMTPQRLALLQEVDFCWNVLDAKWMKRYRELQEYMRIHNTVYNTSISASRSRNHLVNDEKTLGGGGGVMTTTTTAPPRLPVGPLKRWLNFQKQQYKQYLNEKSSTCSTNIMNPPPPQQQQRNQEEEVEEDDDDDQRILATQLTLERRFQLLQKLGFPW